ncbi:peptidoglycan-binding protein [Patescibacteria group bacterium]|nr:peptidoglycan-binding protein [Patescibacteria group bacterium]
MKKYCYQLSFAFVAAGLAMAPFVADAFVNLSGFNIAIPNGITVSVSSASSLADTVTINAGSVDFAMSGGEAVYITSSNGYTLTNSLGAATTCSGTTSSVSLSLSPSAASQTVTLTPSTTVFCSSTGTTADSGGGAISGGGGGGGGGSSYVPPAPAAPSTTPAPQVGSPAVQGTPAAIVSAVFNKDITIGVKSNDVTRLQTLLGQDATVYPEKLLTGYFGPKTVAAVKRFQKKYYITPVNGRVGPKTRAKLNEIFGSQRVVSIPPVTPSPQAAAGQVAVLQAQLKTLQDQLQALLASKPAGKQVTVQLNEQNGSGESGTAILTQVDGTAAVKIEVVRSGPAPLVDTPQLAHIHRGSCSELGNISYPLNALVNGKSETTLAVSLDTLLTQLPLAINIHKSLAEAQIYVACGNITK